MNIDYRNLIGGSVVATRNHEQVAWAQACAALDSENILIMVDVQGDQAVFLALPGVAATSGIMRSPLAAAFPSHPDHQGYGIYLHDIPGAIAAVVRTPNRLEALYNTVPSMGAWLDEREQRELPRFTVGGSKEWEFRPLKLRQAQDGRDVMGRIARLNYWASGMAVALAVSGAIGVTVYKATSGKEDTATALHVTDLAAKELNKYSTTLFELTRVSSLVIRTGGWIEKYSFKGNQTTFEARVPEWVTSDVIKELGNVQTEKDYAKNMVIIRRGEASK